MNQYYDTILVIIPLALLFGLLLTIHNEISLYQGVAFGSFLATLPILDTLFRNPPTAPDATMAIAIILVTISWLTATSLYFCLA